MGVYKYIHRAGLMQFRTLRFVSFVTTTEKRTATGWSLSATGVALVLIATSLSIPSSAQTSIDGWEDLHFNYDNRVSGFLLLVDQKAANARQCVRMCWLFSACSALTFTLDLQRCQLYQSGIDDQVYRTVRESGSLAADMSGVTMVHPRGYLYGCDKRPCRETEMCAPVQTKASYVCISLMSVYCKGDPPDVSNSEAHTDGVSSIVYTCAHGYFRRGTSYISTCDRNTGDWSDVDVTCSFVDCGAPPTLYGAEAHGISTTVDSVVTYSCLDGAVPSSVTIKVTCEGATSQWSTLQGSCSVVTCGQPPTVHSMEVVETPRSTISAYPGLDHQELQRAFGAEAVYTCSTGYTAPEGSTYISQCQADGTWSSTANFLCSPMDCGERPYVANSSHVIYSATTLGENATVACLPGFSPQEGIILTCGNTGSWKGAAHESCRLVGCGDPPSVEASVASYNATVLNATTTYECVQPAVVEGEDNSVAICQQNGEWSSVTLACVPVSCGPAPPVDNSSVTYTSIQTGFSAHYTCDPGYIFDSIETTLQCSAATLQWSDKIIVCLGVECNTPTNVSYATVLQPGPHRFPSQISYECDSGYILTSAASTRTCNHEGTWSLEDVVCDPITCDPSTLPEHTVLETGGDIRDSYSHGDIVTFSCEAGHVMIPTSSASRGNTTGSIACTKGNWLMAESGNLAGLCISCDTPPDVHHATWEIPAERPARAVYVCEPGYVFTSELADTLTCLETNGTWSGDDGARCESVDCGEPPSIANGTFFNTGRKYNDTVTYSCDFGYKAVSGDLNRSCNEDGKWTGTQPECEEWDCEHPVDIDHGDVFYNATSLNSLSEYSCDPGFALSILNHSAGLPVAGSNLEIAVCNEERRWITQGGIYAGDIICSQVECPKAPEIDNAQAVQRPVGRATVGQTVHYVCLNGYQGLGADPCITCEDGGTWSFPFFQCLKIDCGLPPPVKNATVSTDSGTGMGAEAQYSCLQNYYFASFHHNRTCGADGRWSQEFIECLPYGGNHCGEPPIVENAEVEYHSVEPGQRALYHCLEGYKHFWTNAYFCSHLTVSWVANAAVICLPLDCGDIPNVDNADAFYENTTYGSQVFYQCHSGTVATGSTSYTCTKHGTWSTEPLVECLPIGVQTCSSPPSYNSSRAYRSTTPGSKAMHSCGEGFTGDTFESECEHEGFWVLHGSHGCSPVDCGPPPMVENAFISHSMGTSFGDIVMYECFGSDVHTGPGLRACEANAAWSSYVVECAPGSMVFCNDPPVRPHTTVAFESRFLFAEATYTCVKGYTGSDARSFCDGNGQWTEPTIDCKPISCSYPTGTGRSVAFPKVNHLDFGSSVVHLCYESYTPSTVLPLLSICLEDGRWSELDGFCDVAVVDHSVLCDNSLPAIRNGQVLSTSGQHVGAVVRYVCDAGFYSVHAPDFLFHTCLPGGLWSIEPLKCIPSVCIVHGAPSIENGQFSRFDPTFYMSAITGVFHCFPGYTLDGKVPDRFGNNTAQRVLCDVTQGWGTVQECFPVNCGQLNLPSEIETASPFYTTTYGSVVELACKRPLHQSIAADGEVNNSTNTLVCKANGTWSLETINLECKLCEQGIDFVDFNISHGYVEIIRDTINPFGDVASVGCNKDYLLIGNDMVHCEAAVGHPVWAGLDGALCIQTDWWHVTENEKGVYYFPVYMEAVKEGLNACASVLVQDGTKFNMVLQEPPVDVHYTSVAHVHADQDSYHIRYNKKRTSENFFITESVDGKLFNGYTATVCLRLDLGAMKYTFSLNGTDLLEMDVRRYEDVVRLKLSSNKIEVNQVHLEYT